MNQIAYIFLFMWRNHLINLLKALTGIDSKDRLTSSFKFVTEVKDKGSPTTLLC